MFISQSGISLMVRELESQLGFRLFERTTRKVKLTLFGSQFLPMATRYLSELESAAVTIRRSSAADFGTFLVGGIVLVFEVVADCLVLAA
jgi:DNA-binding transcriptional LysR family regulator